MAEAALSLNALTRHYGGSAAVDGVSLSIAPGEFVTLLGPSGSGKTTILRMIAGFERPDGGSIHLGSRDITHAEPERRNIGLVFQSYALFPHMNVADNIAFPLRMRGVPAAAREAAVARMVSMMRMTGFEWRMPRQLSGGQQQRVALARALVFEPPVLLMDEPLSALDRQLRREVQSEIKRIHQSLGVTIVFVTHDQEEAMFLSDRIAVMRQGRIVELGTPAALYAKPASKFVATFVGDANFLAGTIAALDGNVASVRLSNGTLAQGQAVATLAVGQDVACMLRPEQIKLESGAGAVLIGRIELVNFLGGALELECTTPAGPLKIRTATGAYATGDTVHLGWSPADMRIYVAGP